MVSDHCHDTVKSLGTSKLIVRSRRWG